MMLVAELALKLAGNISVPANVTFVMSLNSVLVSVTTVPPIVVPVAGAMLLITGGKAVTLTHVTCVEMFVPNEFVAFSWMV